MNSIVNKHVEQFIQLDEKISLFSNISSLVGWDAKVKAPKKGRNISAKAIGALSTEIFKLSVSKEMGESLEALSQDSVLETLDEVTQARVRERKRFYDRSNKIPSDLVQEYSILQVEANHAWEDARANNDFKTYEPYLEKMFSMSKQFAEYYGYDGHIYNAMLEDYEAGLTVEKLDPIFSNLRKSSVKLLERIQQKEQIKDEFLQKEYNIKEQEQFLLHILPHLGYDLEAGRLDPTAHPFATSINTKDCRITTRYDKNNVKFAIFSTIHEAGHALYESGVNPDFENTVLCSGTSLGIHESQSRFLENMVGRTKEFWKNIYPDLQKMFPNQLNDVTLDEFYLAVNKVEPGMIRVEADELTYNLHVMIRYEIEKALMAGELHVRDLPEVWNDKMEEYLGVRPPNDSVGVLQDVHWSFGAIGYFPTYSLGNLYAAQLLHTIKKEMPDFEQVIARGELMKIREWNRQKIHQYGKLYSPNELIRKATGEELNAQYLVDYLEEKYSGIYGL